MPPPSPAELCHHPKWKLSAINTHSSPVPQPQAPILLSASCPIDWIPLVILLSFLTLTQGHVYNVTDRGREAEGETGWLPSVRAQTRHETHHLWLRVGHCSSPLSHTGRGCPSSSVLKENEAQGENRNKSAHGKRGVQQSGNHPHTQPHSAKGTLTSNNIPCAQFPSGT